MAKLRYLLIGCLAACRFGFTDQPDAPPPPDAPPDAFICSPCLVPSNGLSQHMLGGASARVDGDNLTFDTATGEITRGGVTVRAAGEGVDEGVRFESIGGIGVFVARDFAVPPGTTWTASGANALALFAAYDITIDGALDVGATGTTGGPAATNGGIGGARDQCEGKDGRYKTSNNTGAGGGGGGGNGGGGGGAATVADGQGATLGGIGGSTCVRPATIPLQGGNGGGAGGTENFIIMGGAGGGGGGAVALVAMASVTIHGTVAAPGDGGETINGGSGGGGGGGGGAVLVETLTATITGALTANGGAGGSATNATASATRGQRGHLSDATVATGGSGAGTGAAGTTAANDGVTISGGGGGGGAVGVIEVKTLDATTTGATLSPSPALTPANVE